MQGFDLRWQNLPDYIIGITKEIWEQRGIATLNHYYSDDIIFRMASGIAQGNQAVIKGTLATMAEFPDRNLLTEDVIWSGSPEQGMLSSHRLYCTATHTGNGIFGPATGKKVSFRAIADCHAINNQINDEWLCRDQGSICRQLGIEPVQFARNLIASEGGIEQASHPFNPAQDRPGPYLGKDNDDLWGHKYADLLKRIMQADIAVIQQHYDRACDLGYPGGITGRSWQVAEDFWVGLRASFPSATFTIEHQIGIEGTMLGPRAAIRWSLQGKHDGWGNYGQPSGAEVYIMGFSHADFGPRGIRGEYTVFDETAIWKQILLATG